MTQRTPKICQPVGKVKIPIEDGECLYWLIPVDSVNDIENPTRDFAWITPQGVMYVFDGEKIVPINDPDLLKVQFQNIQGSPLDNGALADELLKNVQTIKMNDRTLPMNALQEVDLGCVTTCEDLESALSGIKTMHAEVVDELPETGDEETIYLIPKTNDPEYIMECHEYAFTQIPGTEQYESVWTTPTNALPIENGKEYLVHIGDKSTNAIGMVSDGVHELTGDGFIITSLQNVDDYTLSILLDYIPEDADVITDDDGNIESINSIICVEVLQDTVYEMYLWIDGEYRYIGAKPIAVDSSKDWNQNNPLSSQYIENRPMYTKDDGTVQTLDDKYLSDNVAMKDDLPIYQIMTMSQKINIPKINAQRWWDTQVVFEFDVPEGYRIHAIRNIRVTYNGATPSSPTAFYPSIAGFWISGKYVAFDVGFNNITTSNTTTTYTIDAQASVELVKD